jgi:DNA-directed RNA polymerase specialized sigma24 family protein
VSPNSPDPTDATQLMLAAAGGDKAAADSLLPLVYAQLRKVAQRDLSREAAGQTLSATALVHEAYLSLVGPREVAWANRAHFYAAAGSDEILAIDEAIGRLESADPQAAALVRLRFYAGLGVEEAAQALELSPRTAARLWTYARAVLYRDLTDSR